MTFNKAGDINPILSDKALRNLNGVLEMALGKRFYKEIIDRNKNGYHGRWVYKIDDIQKAADDAIWSFTFAVEELLDETFETIIDEICEENQWNLTQEQKDELEEGKSL
jgi:hypothetical protein